MIGSQTLTEYFLLQQKMIKQNAVNIASASKNKAVTASAFVAVSKEVEDDEDDDDDEVILENLLFTSHCGW